MDVCMRWNEMDGCIGRIYEGERGGENWCTVFEFHGSSSFFVFAKSESLFLVL